MDSIQKKGNGRYHPNDRKKILDLMEAGHSLQEASEASGVPKRTIVDWRKQKHHEDVMIAENPLIHLRRKVIHNALVLADSLEDTIEDAPLNHRVSALAALIDKLIKLESWSPPEKEAEQVIRIEYQDPDGTRHSTPPWTRGNYAAPSPVQGGGLRTAIRQDGDGQDRAD